MNDWHDLEAAKRSEEWSATYRKKVAAETVFDRRASQFERADNRSSVVWLCRGLNASQERNVARIISSAGAGRGTHRLHRNGGWLKGATRNKPLTKSMRVTATLERGPLRWWNFVTQRQLAGLPVNKTNIVPHGMTIAEFRKTRTDPNAKCH